MHWLKWKSKSLTRPTWYMLYHPQWKIHVIYGCAWFERKWGKRKENWEEIICVVWLWERLRNRRLRWQWGHVWIHESEREMGSGKTHFLVSLFVLNLKWEMRKPLFLFFFFFYTSLLHYHFLIFKVLQLILWSCKFHL